MAGYKKVTKEDAEIFLKLYEKYLLMSEQHEKELNEKINYFGLNRGEYSD